MFDIPPTDSALHRLRHDELCLIMVDGREHEATWSAKIYRFFFKDETGARTIGWDDVEEWRPASTKY